MGKTRRLAYLVAGAVSALSMVAREGRGDAYSDAVMALAPTHYYRLDETTVGTVIDVGSMPINGVHEGLGVPSSDPEIFLGDGVGQVGVPGPDNVYKWDGTTLTTIPLPGFSATNRAIFNNDSLAVNLGAPFGPAGQNLFAHTTMTLATWFKFPNSDLTQPGVIETPFGPGNGGGDRLFTNNFPGEDLPGSSALDTSDVDDRGHFQIDIGGANFIVSIDDRFGGPGQELKSNYQILHRDGNDPGVGIAVKDGSWHHLVVSRNGDDIYKTILVIDGELITTDRYKDSTDSWGITEPYDARIGTRTTAPHHQTWGGWIDEMSLWIGRQLTVSEAQGLWRAATGQAGPGDFQGDGDVDGADFLLWQRGLGTTYDADDLADWKAHFGASAVAASGAVPEPTSLWLGLASVAAGLAGRRARSAIEARRS